MGSCWLDWWRSHCFGVCVSSCLLLGFGAIATAAPTNTTNTHVQGTTSTTPAIQSSVQSSVKFQAKAVLKNGRIHVLVTNAGRYEQVIDLSCTPAFQSGLNEKLPVQTDHKDPGVLRVYKKRNGKYTQLTTVLSSCWRGVTQTWKPGETRSVTVPDSKLAPGTHRVTAWISFEVMRYKGDLRRFSPYRERIRLTTPALRVTVPEQSAERPSVQPSVQPSWSSVAFVPTRH